VTEHAKKKHPVNFKHRILIYTHVKITFSKKKDRETEEKKNLKRLKCSSFSSQKKKL